MPLFFLLLLLFFDCRYHTRCRVMRDRRDGCFFAIDAATMLITLFATPLTPDTRASY